MLHECLFHFQKSKNAQNPFYPFPDSFKGFRNRAAASKLARLIDPAYSNRDWLICQPVKTHFLTEPTSPFIGRSRNPIRSSDAKSTRTAPRRQPLFSENFHFPSNPLILLGEIDVFSGRKSRDAASLRPFRPRISRAEPRLPAPKATAHTARRLRFHPFFALSACVLRRVPYAVSRRARTHFARASKG